MRRLGPEGEPIERLDFIATQMPPRIAKRYIVRPGSGGVLRERPHKHTAAEELGRENYVNHRKPFIPAYVRKAPPIEFDTMDDDLHVDSLPGEIH